MNTSLEIVGRKRDGESLSGDEISQLITGYMKGELSDLLMAAYLTAACCQGLSPAEIEGFTQSLIATGLDLSWVDLSEFKLNLLSTHGMGSKLELALAPVMAACGICVPLIRQEEFRGWGGLLERVLTIPEFRTEFSVSEFKQILEQQGIAIAQQPADIAPASAKLRSIQQQIGGETCLTIMASTFLSPYLALGMDGLVFDVRSEWEDVFAFEQGTALVQTMRAMNKQAAALVTDGSQPLGWAVGDTLELLEIHELLRGQTESRFGQTAIQTAAYLLWMGTGTLSLEVAEAQAQAVIGSGQAMEKWQQLIEAQGGDPQITEDDNQIPLVGEQTVVEAPMDGVVSRIDVEAVGRAARELEARATATTLPELGVGIRLHVEVGSEVEAGDPLCTIYSEQVGKRNQAEAFLEPAFVIAEQGADVPDPIRMVLMG